MINPEFIGPVTERQHERLRGAEAISRLSFVLDNAAEAIEDKEHQVPFSDADQFIADELLTAFYGAVEAARGYPIKSESRSHEYLVKPDPDSDRAERARVQYRRYGTYRIEGIVQGYERPLYEDSFTGKLIRPLCLVLGPLSQLPPEDLSSVYKLKTWKDQLMNPFGDDQQPGSPAYVPVKMISDGSTLLLDGWNVS